MGINCIGDQIAILQAAKRYCGEQYHPNNTLSFPKPKQLSPQLESNGSDMMEVEEIAPPANNSPCNQMANSVAPQVSLPSEEQQAVGSLYPHFSCSFSTMFNWKQAFVFVTAAAAPAAAECAF